MEQEQVELKPCPFCGGEAKIKRIGNEHCKKMQVRIECKTLGCMAFQQCSTLTKLLAQSFEWLTEKATIIWNTRVPHDALKSKADCSDELVAVVKGLMKEAEDGSARFDDPEPDSIYMRANQVLAEVKNPSCPHSYGANHVCQLCGIMEWQAKQ